ncbi:MAG: cyclase, partial [Mycobacteriaceae bacterium]|nr:cyclase [Mycobacteriaceae bacterium]
DDKTRVRFDITIEPRAPLPEFLIKRAKRAVLNAATEGLRRRIGGVRAVGGARGPGP